MSEVPEEEKVHLPKQYEKVDEMPQLDIEVQKIQDYLGPFSHDKFSKTKGQTKEDLEILAEDKTLPYDGPYEIPEDKAVYDGQWKFGTRHGRGRQIFLDGSVYVGTWVDNKKHGLGRMISKQGFSYEGQFEDD